MADDAFAQCQAVFTYKRTSRVIGIALRVAARPVFVTKETDVFEFVSCFIRPDYQKSDRCFLVLALIVGCGFGTVLGHKISLTVGLPFSVFASLVLYYLWRRPGR